MSSLASLDSALVSHDLFGLDHGPWNKSRERGPRIHFSGVVGKLGLSSSVADATFSLYGFISVFESVEK